ncbi:MAG: hypothetical protein PVG22_02320 [Chromatiales bacterium]|jgi:hypothetical protein
MATYNRIGLIIPEQVPPVGKTYYLDEKETDEWIGQLPLANIGETSRRLYLALQEFNHTAVAHKRRVASTEKFRRPIDYVIASLNKHYLDAGFPLSDKAHKIADLNRELHAGLATSYKSAVSDIILTNRGKAEHRLLCLALHRAVHHLSRIILLSVLIYDRFPKRIWFELHTLHRLAREYDLESLLIKDPQESQGLDSSIDQAYRRILLFCLASPYKFRQRENLQIYDALLAWANYSHLSPADEALSDSSIFVQQDMDLPSCQGTFDPHNGARHLIRLDFGELIRKLREQIEGPSAVDKLQAADSLDKHLLRKLIQLWSAEQKRTFMRTRLNFELQIAVGIGKIHRLLQRSDKQKSEMGEESVTLNGTGQQISEDEFASLSRFSPAAAEAHDHAAVRRDGFEECGPDSGDQEGIEPPVPIAESQESRQGRVDTFLLQTLNESAGGYCLNWCGDQIPKILVGELLGIQSSLASQQFGIGLVRWMKSNPNQGMQVGVQMIAPNATAVTAKKSADSKHPLDCLLLPEVGSCGQPTSFVCPAFHFKTGDLLSLQDQGQNREIKLTRLLESSGSISQFQFTYLDGPAFDKGSDNKRDGLEGIEDFEQLWPCL